MLNKLIKKKIFKDTIWVVGAKIGAALLEVLLGVILTRVLSPRDFGLYQIVQRIILLGGVFGSFGMAWVIVRLVAEGIAENKYAESYNNAITIYKFVFVLGVSAAFIYYLSGLYMPSLYSDGISDLSLFISISIVLMSFQNITPECFRGLHDIKYASIFSGFATNSLLLFIVFILYILNIMFTINEMVVVVMMTRFIVCFVSVYLLFRILNRFKNIYNNKKHSFQDLVFIGFPLFMSTVLMFVVNQADVWIIVNNFSPKVAAYYAAAARLTIVLTVPLMIANAVIKPKVSELWIMNKKKELEVLLQKVAVVTFSMSLVPVLIFLLYSKDILGYMYGEFYIQGYEIINILSLGQLATLIMGPCSVLVVMAGHQKVLMIASFFGACVFIISAFVLVHFYEAYGVACSVVLGSIITQIIMTMFCYIKLRVRTYICVPIF